MNRLRLDPNTATIDQLAPAADWLRRDGIVAFPTDTFYGLAADPRSPRAIQELFDLKGRDAQFALPLVAASTDAVIALCGSLSSTNVRLAASFWPGPLSLVLDAPRHIAAEVHGGRHSIAIRVPDHRVARLLAAAFGSAVTATSANRSGERPALTVHDLAELAKDRRVFVVDGGAAPGGSPSTIVDARGSHPVLVRDGAIAWSRVLTSLKE